MKVNGKMAHSTGRVFRQILKASQEKEFGKMEKEQVGLVVLYKIHQNEVRNSGIKRFKFYFYNNNRNKI